MISSPGIKQPDFKPKNFADFEKVIQDLEAQRTEKKRCGYCSSFLYRGQPNSEWGLETTLERTGRIDESLIKYYQLALRVRPQLESLLDKKMENIPTYEEIKTRLESEESHHLPAYDYLIYLRHHGFPSPLLDWSQSPYVALFFAMQSVAKDVDFVSVYAFMDHAGKGKSGGGNSPAIERHGHLVATHRRHVLQRSEYTVCIDRDNAPKRFAQHENALTGPYSDIEQDLLWKIDLPVTIRYEVLMKLDQYNLNAYSLFGTEEALLKNTLFARNATYAQRQKHTAL